MDCESGQFRGSIFGFEHCRVREHIWGDTGPVTQYGTVRDGDTWFWLTAGYSQGNSQPSDLNKSSYKVCLHWGGGLQLPIQMPIGAPQVEWLMGFIYKLWNWLYDDRALHPLNMPVTHVMANAMSKGTHFPCAPHVILLLQNWTAVWEALSDLLLQLPHLGLTNTKNITVTRKWERQVGESRDSLQWGGNLLMVVKKWDE